MPSLNFFVPNNAVFMQFISQKTVFFFKKNSNKAVQVVLIEKKKRFNNAVFGKNPLERNLLERQHYWARFTIAGPLVKPRLIMLSRICPKCLFEKTALLTLYFR